jgi:hypothetical protein
MRVSPAPIQETQAGQALPALAEPSLPADAEPVPSRPKRRGLGWVILIGFLVVLLLGGIGAYAGYQEALRWRLENEQSQSIGLAKTQFDLAMVDVQEGRLEIAQQRYEYIIGIAPDFPGIKEQLTRVMVFLQQTRVPTEAPTATPIPLTPTPDTRTEQDIFSQIQQAMKDKKWDAAIAAMDALRAQNLSYRSVDVDGMYYIALRGRGTDKILRLADLEGGMYDLALAERFGPLDRDAVSYRTWARTYLTGASFWQVDWEKVVYYFSQVASAAPSLMDGSKMTAAERYKIALVKWGDKLAPDEPCKAAEQYAAAIALGRMQTLEAGATEMANRCAPPTETPQPKTNTPTRTPTVTGTLASATPAAGSETPTSTLPVATATPSATLNPPTAAPTATATPTLKP